MATRTAAKPARAKRHPLATWTGPERRYDLIAEGKIAATMHSTATKMTAIVPSAMRS